MLSAGVPHAPPELVPPRWPGSARRHRVAAEVVARPGGSAACQPAAVPDRMKACVGAHDLSRKLKSVGHDVREILSPVSKGQKNDFRDAEAIAEAVQRPTMSRHQTVEWVKANCRQRPNVGSRRLRTQPVRSLGRLMQKRAYAVQQPGAMQKTLAVRLIRRPLCGTRAGRHSL